MDCVFFGSLDFIKPWVWRGSVALSPFDLLARRCLLEATFRRQVLITSAVKVRENTPKKGKTVQPKRHSPPDSLLLPCASWTSARTNYTPSWYRSCFALQCERYPGDETCGFLLETDQGHDWCSRQQGLDAVQKPGNGHPCCHQATQSRCPISSYYATKRWLSTANKKGICTRRVYNDIPQRV